MHNIFKSYGLDKDIDKVTKKLDESINCNINAESDDFIDININTVCDDCEQMPTEPAPSKEEFFDTAFDSAFGISNDMDDDALVESLGDFPSWITRNLHLIKSYLLKRNIDLAHAKFIEADVPTSSRSVMLKNDTKIPVVLLNTRHNRVVLWLPGINDSDLDWWRDDGTYASSLQYVTKQELLKYAKKFGYIDITDASNMNTTLRRERAELRSRGDKRRPEKGLHPVERRVYGTKEDGRKDWDSWTTEINWVTDRGYDKSGYPLDPQKYKKMLDNVGLDTYASRLQKYHDQIESARAKLAEQLQKFDILSSSNFVSDAYSSFDRNIFSAIGHAISLLSSAIYEYQNIEKSIQSILERPDSYYEAHSYTRDEAIRSTFEWSGKRLREAIKDLNKEVEGIINAKDIRDND